MRAQIAWPRSLAWMMAACFAVAAASDMAAGEVVVFERDYVRSSGRPVVVADVFEAAPGTATLTLFNRGVSSAVVELNGERVFGPPDFNPHVVRLDAPVELGAENRLRVELRGTPGRSCTVRVTQVRATEPTIYYLSSDGRRLRRILPDGTDEFVASAPYGGCYLPAVSAAGDALLMSCGTNGWDTAMWVVAADGSGSRQVVASAWSQHSSWHVNDTEVAYDVALAGLHRMPAAGGPGWLWIPVSQFAPFGKNAFRGHGLRWSADRTRFAANVGVASAGGNEIFVGNIDFATGVLSNIRRVSPPAGSSWNAAAGGVDISADGEWVYYSWRDIAASWQDVRRVRFDGSDEQVLWGRTVPGDTGIGNVELSPDGERLWFQPCVVESCAIASITLDGADYEEVATAEPPGTFDLAQR